MSRDPLDLVDSVVPEFADVMAEVDRTFTALRDARSRFNRSRLEASKEAARRQMVEAEAAYRRASDQRDRLVELRNARLTQRGDARGALWSKPEVEGPVIEPTPCLAEVYRSGKATGERCAKPAGHKSACSAWWPQEEPRPHDHRTQVRLARAGGYEPRPFAAGSDRHVAVWDAIAAYTMACGGDPTGVSDDRMKAVVAVERALEALCRR